MELQVLIPRFALSASVAAMLSGCEKEITVKLPETEPKVVVEGSIETGQAPLVFLTRTQSYFAPTSVSSIASTFISDAKVWVNGDSLTRICSSLVPDSLIDEVSASTGIAASILRAANICAWTKLDGSLVGVEGQAYDLRVETEGKVITSRTIIPQGVALDSTWFKLANQRPNDDTLGFIWGRLSDPDTLGNGYRWFARRTNAGADGQPKDTRYLAPLFSVFEDRYVNGLTYDFAYNRGNVPFSDAEDDTNEERGFFKVGDTVSVKFASIGLAEFNFFESYASNVSSQGDVFSNPSNVRTNINGGLGIWVGYATRFSTVVCQP